MKFFGSGFVGLVRPLRRWVAPKVDGLFIASNTRLIGIIFEPRMMRDTLESIFVAVLAVCSVLAVASFSQVVDAVICALTIFVINLLPRPFAMDVKPRQPVCRVRLPKQLYVYVAAMVRAAAGSFPDAHFWSWRAPRKDSRQRIIGKNLHKPSVRDLFHITHPIAANTR
jgi:hypothetical protein